MSETVIQIHDGNVVYTMPPWVAGSLAEILAHEATHYRDGKERPIARYDQGWISDAQRLAEKADAMSAGAGEL